MSAAAPSPPAAPATQDLGSTDEDEPSPAPAGPAPWGTLVSLSSHPPLDLTGGDGASPPAGARSSAARA